MNTQHDYPRTMADFLAQLRAHLHGSDPAMIQDALYDSEDYLRAAIADNAALSESEVMAKVLNDYGTPQEVAANYRTTEATVQAAIKPSMSLAPTEKPQSFLRRVFGVFSDPYSYGALFYMLLSLWTGIFYFTYVAVGVSVSLGTIVLIFGIPLLILFLGSVRILALVEGRIVEALLGVRMPRRPSTPLNHEERGWIPRIKGLFTDPRTWSTMLYLLLMLPLGVIYFAIAVTLVAVAGSMFVGPLAILFGEVRMDNVVVDGSVFNMFGLTADSAPWVVLPLLVVVGVVLITLTLHVARWVGRLHGALAKNLLVTRF